MAVVVVDVCDGAFVGAHARLAALGGAAAHPARSGTLAFGVHVVPELS